MGLRFLTNLFKIKFGDYNMFLSWGFNFFFLNSVVKLATSKKGKECKMSPMVLKTWTQNRGISSISEFRGKMHILKPRPRPPESETLAGPSNLCFN